METHTAYLPRSVKCINCGTVYDPYRRPTCPQCSEVKFHA